MTAIKNNIKVDKPQFRFRIGMGTRNATYMLKTILERVAGKQKDILMCFIDFEKASDTVPYATMIEK